MKNISNKSENLASISTYECITKPIVIEEIDVYTYFENLSCPNKSALDKIKKARYHYNHGNKEKYNEIKRILPCYTLNFGFNEYKTNTNIIGSTGFIYLDIDNVIDIDLTNNLIFASWRSLSNNGRGVLVKTEGLTLENFKYNYIAITKKLGIKADVMANKPTQFTVQSYDPDLYINNDSEVYNTVIEKVKEDPTTVVLNKKKDSTVLGTKSIIRYNNLDDYIFNNEDYLFYPENKERIKEMYVPNRIYEGKRNTTLYTIGLQYRGLNPFILEEDVERLLSDINQSKCKPALKYYELILIVKSVMNNINPKGVKNTFRRIIFNPKKNFNRIEKITICNKLTGILKSKKTYSELINYIKNWDYSKHKKITIKNLTEVSKRNKKTISKYYKRLRAEHELITFFKKNLK